MDTRVVLVASLLLCMYRPGMSQTGGVRGSVIEGDVVDGDTGQGIPGARVKLFLESDEPWFTLADRTGHFRFSGVPAGGSYGLAARHAGFMGPGDTPQSWGGSRSARPGGAEPVRIILIRYGVIAGTVTDSSGSPVSMSRVEVMRKVPVDANLPGMTEGRLADGNYRLARVGTTNTDQRGNFRMWRLATGTYYVMAQPQHDYIAPEDERRARGTFYGASLDLGGAKPIEVIAGRTTGNLNIQILKQAGFRVSGQIANMAAGSGGAQSEDVFTSVWLESLSAESGSANWGYAKLSGNRFEIDDVLPGKYLLHAATRERYGNPNARRELAASVQAVEVGQTDLSGLVVAPQPPRDLAGVVRFDNRCRKASVRLHASSSMAFNRSDAPVNSDGSFVLKDLLPSRYWLHASVQGDPFAALGPVRLGGRESENSFLMAGDDYGPLQVEIVCPRGKLSGEVREASGAPAKSGVIALVPPLMPGNRQSFAYNGGRFDITVRTGIYDIFACSVPSNEPRYSGDCQKAEAPLTVTDGADLRLTLTPPAALGKDGSR